MKIEIVGQFGAESTASKTGDFIKNQIRHSNGKYQKFTVYVAFATKTAVNTLLSELENEPNLKACLNVGVDNNVTSMEAVEALLNCGYEVNIIHTRSSLIFHPKIYIFEGEEYSLVLMGSSNLTASALSKNIEANVALELDLSNDNDLEFLTNLKVQLGTLEPNTKSLDQDLFDHLIDRGLLISEINVQRDLRKRAVSQNVEKIFPAINRVQAGEANRVNQNQINDDNEVIEDRGPTKFWYESGSMTGGSRNILDLSLKGTNGINGGVSLFGIAPDDINIHTRSKLILKRFDIHFEGKIFEDNLIVFPMAAVNKRSNGTPRLQIKGITVEGEKITKAVGSGGLRFKVILFSKLNENSYQMELLDFDENKDDIINNSALVGRPRQNTGKLFGILEY
tara:strand:+ start:3657 stop:4841 length:1185 start_codon:yes stop_codon:yes gene_type:complete